MARRKKPPLRSPSLPEIHSRQNIAAENRQRGPKTTLGPRTHRKLAVADHDSDLTPGLYVTATPIGNASDITLRALEVLASCDAIVTEDTRVTSRLLAIHGIRRPLLSYNDHNAPQMRPKLVERLCAGARLALVSDAGTPLISDPGHKLVRAALDQDIAVHPVPGPSAVLAALSVAGLPTDRFLFVGFLPAKAGERRRVLAEIGTVPATLVFFEAPSRLSASLADMSDILGARAATVTRELTKLFEEMRRGALSELADIYGAHPVKGEVTIVVAGAAAGAPDMVVLDSLLLKGLPYMPVGALAGLVAEATGLPKRTVYARALSLKDDGPDLSRAITKDGPGDENGL